MATIGGSSRRFPGGNFKFFSVGGGDLLAGITKTVVAVNPASLATLTKAGTVVTVPGVAAGDIVIAIPPATLEDDLIPAGAVASGADEVTLYLYNASAGSVDGASLSWTFLHFKLA